MAEEEFGRIPFAWLQATKEALERKGYAYFPVEREHIEALVTEPLAHRLRTTIKKRGFRKVAGHTIITFSGYETDPREVFEVPEARTYYQKLAGEFPELPALVAFVPELRFNGPMLYVTLLGEVDLALPRPEITGFDLHVVGAELIIRQAVERIRRAGEKYKLQSSETEHLAATFLVAGAHRLS